MAGIQLSGLASGFDWQTLVDNLMTASKIPQDRLRTEKTTLESRTNAVNEIKTALTDFQTSLKALSSGDLFLKRTASLANTSSGWTASAAADTSAGDYVFQIQKLATRAHLDGTTDVSSALSATSDVSGVLVTGARTAQAIKAGDFTVNGAKISVASTDSLQDVFNKISTATSGAVTASYDPATDRVNLTGAGTITLGSSNDTSNFLTALKLFNNGSGTVTSSGALGTIKQGGAIASAGLKDPITAVDGAGAGTFKINGVEIAYNINNDSIQGVLKRINDSNAGVTASYDAAQDRFLLTNRNTGDMGISIEEAPGGMLSALGLSAGATLVRGENAEFTLNNGGTLISQSNTLDESVHGVAGLTVTAASETTETVRVAGDGSDARAKLEDLIKKYNAAQTLIEKYTGVTVSGTKTTPGILAGYREIGALSQSLRGQLFSAMPSGAESVTRLADLGIDFKGSQNQLEIKDSTALTKALTERAKDVSTFFADQTNGFVSRLDSTLQKLVGTGGTLETQTTSFQNQSKRIDTQIANMQRQLDKQREILEANFIRMEQAQSTLQQQSAALTKALVSNS